MSDDLLVEVEDRSGLGVDTGAARRVAAAALRALGYANGELGLAFVDEEEITRLNRKFMGRSGPTDVLSFPLDAEGAKPTPGVSAGTELSLGVTGGGQPPGVPALLGDIVICPQVARRQAGELGTTKEKELCLLVIHGVLHIAGFDHEADVGQMDARQAEMVESICGAG